MNLNKYKYKDFVFCYQPSSWTKFLIQVELHQPRVHQKTNSLSLNFRTLSRIK